MPEEGNEFYAQLGATWAAISGGELMGTDWSSREVKVGYYGKSNYGFGVTAFFYSLLYLCIKMQKKPEIKKLLQIYQPLFYLPQIRRSY